MSHRCRGIDRYFEHFALTSDPFLCMRFWDGSRRPDRPKWSSGRQGGVEALRPLRLLPPAFLTLGVAPELWVGAAPTSHPLGFHGYSVRPLAWMTMPSGSVISLASNAGISCLRLWVGSDLMLLSPGYSQWGCQCPLWGLDPTGSVLPEGDVSGQSCSFTAF